MAQVFDPVPSDHPSRILCCYINATSKIQIVRITNIVNWYFERVVFPGQRLVFEALASGQLEVHSGAMASAILSDTIPCQRLKVSAEKPEKDASGSKESTSSNSPGAGNQPRSAQEDIAAARPTLYQPV